MRKGSRKKDHPGRTGANAFIADRKNRNPRPRHRIMVVDVAHPPLNPLHAEGILDEALRAIRLSPHLRILKIIHGYGSTGKGGSLKTTVRNWIFGKRNKIRCSIDGERIDTLDAGMIELATCCDISPRDDLGSANAGMTIVWVK